MITSVPPAQFVYGPAEYRLRIQYKHVREREIVDVCNMKGTMLRYERGSKFVYGTSSQIRHATAIYGTRQAAIEISEHLLLPYAVGEVADR